MSRETALAGRIRSEWEELTQVAVRAQKLAAKVQERQDFDYVDGIALNLHGFYAGAERIFEQIARELDGSVPEGGEWHRGLLLQMCSDVAGCRPSVISKETRACLEEYRAFRHVVRNVYAFRLRPTRILDLAEGLGPCVEALSRDLDAFCSFLVSL